MKTMKNITSWAPRTRFLNFMLSRDPPRKIGLKSQTKKQKLKLQPTEKENPADRSSHISLMAVVPLTLFSEMKIPLPFPRRKGCL